MTNLSHAARRCYLYAIASPLQPLPANLHGLEGRPVHGLACGHISAIVSAIDQDSVRPLRAHLRAHHDVIRALMTAGTVLPVAFGTLVGETAQLRAVLAGESARLAVELERLQGRVEMGVRARLAVPDVYMHLAACFPSLRAARDAVFGSPAAGRDEKIALGMQVEQALEQLRERCAAAVLPALQPCCTELCRKPPAAVDELLHLACLVPRNELPAFEAALAAVARTLDNSHGLTLSGPWAPHHFCAIGIECLSDAAGA